jgi:hypothetical protein
MEIGEEFILPVLLRGADIHFVSKLTYASTQVMRFHLKYKTKEMEMQKILLPKTRFAWKLTHCNFEFKHEHAGENINIIFKALDEVIKNPPSLLEHIRNKKSW